MTIDARGYHIYVSGLQVEVVRKDIKNVHIGVYPPGGRVRVAVPLHLDDEVVRNAIILRQGWIRRQRARFEQQDRQSLREFVTGESHYFAGRRYRLDVNESNGRPTAFVRNNSTIELRVHPGADRDTRESVLLRWYRSKMQEQVPKLIAKWEPKIGVVVAEWRIRRMKTRWGTCNREARRIWLNLELVKKKESCLEYILVHEMVHLIERRHNERFWKLMDRFMPQWRMHRDELNQAPLAHENWQY